VLEAPGDQGFPGQRAVELQGQAVEHALVGFRGHGRGAEVLGQSVVGDDLAGEVRLDLMQPACCRLDTVAGMQKAAPIRFEVITLRRGPVLAEAGHHLVDTGR
jgi:hypothetical protein